MILKRTGRAAALLFLALAPAAAAAQAGNHPASSHPAAPASAAPAAPASTAAPAPSENPNCPGGSCDFQQPHITIATPAPAPAPWPLQDRIAWTANLLLVLIAYAGILVALSTLRKIERQTRYAETAADAAADAAKAALLFAETQAKTQSQIARPWILITVEPASSVPNRYSVVVANRGVSPARIVSFAEAITVAKDDSGLPSTPAFHTEPLAPRIPLILLPGESAGIKSFGRNELLSMCENTDQLRRVEDWDDKIYLYGKIAYRSLLASGAEPGYETAWCCWFVNSSQKCGMVIAGPPAYNQHT